MGNYVGVKTNRKTVGPLAFGADPGDAFFICLLAERGPTNRQVLINSMSRFEAVFGKVTPAPQGASEDEYSAGYEVLSAFFSKSGKKAVVLRVVGSGATTADVTIEDRGSTPQDTLTVAGLGEGTWANDYDVKISDGAEADTFKIEVLDPDSNTVETWDNLKMIDSDIKKVNDGSDLIQLTDEGSTNSPPADRPATGTYDIGDDTTNGSATNSTTGADDNNPSASDVVGTESSDGSRTGLKTFRSHQYGRGFICAPDLDDDSTVISELEAIADNYYRFYLTSTDEGATLSTAQTQKGDHDHFASAIYFPRPKVKDASTSGIKTIPAVGHVAADWQKAVEQDGPGKVPAGPDFKVNFVQGIETQSNGQPYLSGPSGNAETLLSKKINPIYDRDGTGLKVWGGRAATSETAWKYMHAAYLYNAIASRVQDALDQLIYDVADDQFFQQVKLGIRSFMIDLHKDGAFNGAIPGENEVFDPDEHAFKVQCDESLLSDTDKQNGIVKVKIVFQAALVAETIEVDLAKQTAT